MTSKLSATVLDDPEANSAKRIEGHVLDTLDLPKEHRHLDQLLETSPTAAASAILAGLTDPDTEQAWRRRLVLAAEVAGFTELQDQQLAPALRSFIDEFRDSNRRDDQVVVCSAIRTYVGLIPVSDLDCLAAVLEPGHRASPGTDTLLEAIKMVARKTAANPPSTDNQHPRLSEQLVPLARAHMNPYVLPRGKSEALAMNAILAVAGLASPAVQDLVGEVVFRARGSGVVFGESVFHVVALGTNVVFRSAKARTFAERKTTLSVVARKRLPPPFASRAAKPSPTLIVLPVLSYGNFEPCGPAHRRNGFGKVFVVIDNQDQGHGDLPV
jgi:hypothetical protein